MYDFIYLLYVHAATTIIYIYIYIYMFAFHLLCGLNALCS